METMTEVGVQPGMAEAASPGPYDELLARKLDELRGEQAGASPEYFRIRLVKALRESTGLRLTEAADVVDDYYRRRGFAVRSLRHGLAGSAGWGLLGLAVAAVGVWMAVSSALRGPALVLFSPVFGWLLATLAAPLVRALRDGERRR
ncbi:MAG TPA: hypothetical protein VK689_07405 [Armatimonadota bacterium]|nr:hypothetical protein [Armatimonadota bacterium]